MTHSICLMILLYNIHSRPKVVANNVDNFMMVTVLRCCWQQMFNVKNRSPTSVIKIYFAVNILSFTKSKIFLKIRKFQFKTSGAQQLGLKHEKTKKIIRSYLSLLNLKQIGSSVVQVSFDKSQLVTKSNYLQDFNTSKGSRFPFHLNLIY